MDGDEFITPLEDDGEPFEDVIGEPLKDEELLEGVFEPFEDEGVKAPFKDEGVADPVDESVCVLAAGPLAGEGVALFDAWPLEDEVAGPFGVLLDVNWAPFDGYPESLLSGDAGNEHPGQSAPVRSIVFGGVGTGDGTGARWFMAAFRSSNTDCPF